MTVNITGNRELLRELERRFGEQASLIITDRALKKGARAFVQELKRQFESFKDTGASIDEITISEPLWVGSNRTIKIYWKGPKHRYSVIHLNEWGTVNNPNPRGKGAIAKALRNSKEVYRNVVKEELRRGV